mgnify:CR=1 FL=1
MGKEVNINLNANIEKATSSFNEVGLQIDELNDNIKDFRDTTKKALEKVNQDSKKTSKGFALIKKGVKGIGGAMKSLLVGGLALVVAGFATLAEGLRNNQKALDAVNIVMGTVQQVAADVAKIFINMFQRVNELTGGFDALQKVVGGSLTIALNVVVGTIQGLVLGFQKAQLAFEQSFLGGNDENKIAELQDKIEATENKLVQTGENISNAGKQIADNFVEAVGEVGQLAQGVADATQKSLDEIDITSAKSRAERLVQLQKDAQVAIAENDRLQFKFQRDAELQRQIRDDVSKSIEERTAANEKLGGILDEQEKLQKANANIQIDLAKERLKIDENNVENQVALIEAKKNLADVEENIEGFRSEQDVNRVGLEIEQLDLIKSKTEAENARMIQEKEFTAQQKTDALERINDLIAVAELEKQIEEQRLQEQIQNYAIGTQARTDAEQAFEDFKVASEQKIEALGKQKTDEEIKREDSVRDAKIQIAKQGLALIQDIAGKGSKIGKAAAIAQATISGVQGVQNAFTTASASPVTIGFPAYPFIQAGLAGAMALKNINSIVSGSKPKASGGAGGSNVATPRSAAPAFNVVGTSSTNQLAETISGQNDKPVRAYVTSGEVTTAQSLERSIIEQSTIG